MNSRAKGLFLVLMSAVLWGTGGIAGQLAYANSNITTPWLLSTRMIFAGVVLTAFAFVQKGRNIFDIFKSKRDLIIFLIYCIFGNWLVQYSYFAAIKASNAATATLLQYLAPSIVLVVVAVKNKKFPRLLEIMCVVLALLGLFLISTHGAVTSLSISPVALFWGVISACSLTINNTLPLGILKRHGTYSIVGIAMLIGGIATTIVFRPYGNLQGLEISNAAWWYIVYVVIFGTTIPFSGFSAGVKIVGSTTGSIIANIEPLTAAVVSIVFLNMSFTVFDVIGFCLIIGAAIVLTLFDKNVN